MGQISFWSMMIQLIYYAQIHTVKKNKEGLLVGSRAVGDEVGSRAVGEEVNTEKTLCSCVINRM